MRVCVFVLPYVSLDMYEYISRDMHVCMHKHTYVCVCVCVCVYTHIYIYIVFEKKKEFSKVRVLVCSNIFSSLV